MRFSYSAFLTIMLRTASASDHPGGRRSQTDRYITSLVYRRTLRTLQDIGISKETKQLYALKAYIQSWTASRECDPSLLICLVTGAT